MENRIVAIICAIVALAGVVLLGVGVKKYSENQNDIASAYAEFGNKLSALEAEKKEAERAILALDDEIDTVEAHATVSLLFCGMSEDIYNVIFPVMEEYGIKGTVVMTGDRLPGVAGRLTDAQIVELVGAGWKLIPGWTDGDGENGIASVDEWIRAYGYTVEGAVFMQKNDHTDERETLLAQAGYNTVILDIGNGGSDAVSTDEVGDIWYPVAMGYQGNGPKAVLLETIELKGNLIFTVGFEETNEMYLDDKFPSMLSYLKSYEEDGVIDNIDVASARAYRAERDAKLTEINNIISLEKEVHKTRIVEIDEEIDALYAEYKSH